MRRLLLLLIAVWLCGCGVSGQQPAALSAHAVASAAPDNSAVSLTISIQPAASPRPSASAYLKETIIQEQQSAPGQQAQPSTSAGRYTAMPLPEEMRAMWISFLEWQNIDISTQEKFTQEVGKMFDNCKNIGLNTVIVAVRPFSDAMYKSGVYPWSHLITGKQGQAPGFDPLGIMTNEAHKRGLRIEAWVNPYRAQHPTFGPSELADANPAVTNPEWLRKHEGLWLDPGYPQVTELIAQGVSEIVQNYEIDGIHFDDYFYPEGCNDSFDDASYVKYANGADRAEWRRANTAAMVKRVYQAVKAANPTVSFGISPQGNNENNYNQQYCDVNLFMDTPGYADYVMPQLYWGFNYSRNGDTKAAFGNKVAEWNAYAKHSGLKLYAGLGAYRIGEGDGSRLKSDEWKNGRTIADMVSYVKDPDHKTDGFAIFNYLSLFPGEDGEYAGLAGKEVSALRAVLR